MRTLVLALGLTALPALVSAQGGDTVRARAGLPRDVAREVVALYNATTTLRTADQTEIPAGRDVAGDVAVLNGPVVIAGHVAGRVLAINADVLLRPGARIEGDLLVVGGEVEGSEGATIGGELRIYHPPLRYTMEGDRLVAQDEEPATEELWWRRFERMGRDNANRLEIATAGVYNRVEGLPVRIGPVLYRDQGWGHVRFAANAILRTGSSFSSSTPDVGHLLLGEVRIGRRFGATLGGRLHDQVDGVESWQLSNAEVGLASFLFHRDYRDYYGRHGGQLYASLRATENADLTLSYGDERWRSREARDPPTLLNNGLAWRPNPTMDAGLFHLANLTLRIDTRNDTFNPWAGWYLLADYERGSGTIEVPGAVSTGVGAAPAGPVQYQRAFVDLRRYNRINPTSALNLRIVLGGWMSGDPLPLERRLSIDGPGTVPGFDFRSGGVNDVGTCATSSAPPGRPAQCERIGLAQLEYRSDLRISFSSDAGGAPRTRFRADGAWIFFADAGRGWLVNAPGSTLNFGRHDFPPLSTYRTDIGAGLDFNLLGIYAAKALSAPREPMKVFLRVRHRF
ncbi:MAG TPA: BamA/TamA family outer membrane protein [Gemmatimonadaceae bacterium]|nr:BamA/TamA family outer membrane protein [Gemmatimonadaceae bacterium]